MKSPADAAGNGGLTPVGESISMLTHLTGGKRLWFLAMWAIPGSCS